MQSQTITPTESVRQDSDLMLWELNQNGGAVWVQRNRAIMIQVFFNRQNQKALI